VSFLSFSLICPDLIEAGGLVASNCCGYAAFAGFSALVEGDCAAERLGRIGRP
jgi:hypothetical protein